MTVPLPVVGLPAPAPPVGDLRRTVSTPGGGVRLEPLPCEVQPGAGVEDDWGSFPPNGFQEGVRKRRHAWKHRDEGQQALVRAVEELSLKVDGLGKRVEEERRASMLREANVTRLTEVLASAAESILSSKPPGPQPSSRSSRQEVAQVAQACDERLLEALGALGGQLERQAEEQWRWQKRILEERRSDAVALQEVVEAIHGLKSLSLPSAEDQRPEACHPAKPRYRPHIGADGRLYEFPEVHVAIKIYQVGNVDTKQLSFEADFVCYLDWYDPNVTNIPSDQLQTLDWTQYFNPQIEVDNAKDPSGWLDGMDSIPRRPRATSDGDSVTNVGGLGGGLCRSASFSLGPRLRKTMRFRGTLSMASANLKCFPFDIQMLPIRVKAARCRGLPMGTPTAGWEAQCKVTRVHLVSEGEVGDVNVMAEGQGHYAMASAGESLMEFRLCGLAGYHPDGGREDVYEVSAFVARPFFASYFWDIVIMNLLVMLAASAFWDTAAPELSSRMSISLTVILTLAAYTSSRPEPIAKAPYVTFHDWCEQISMFLVTGISVQNVFAVVMCGGQHGEAPPYMVAEFEENQEICSLGWCKSRSVDCRGLVILLVAWFALMLYSVIWLVRTRSNATQELRARFPRNSKHSRLCLGIKGDNMKPTNVKAYDQDTPGDLSYTTNSLDSWTVKARRCFCCPRRCCSEATSEAEPPAAVSPAVSALSPASESSRQRPRPRPLSIAVASPSLNLAEEPSEPAPLVSPLTSVLSSPESAQAKETHQGAGAILLSATPPNSARGNLPSNEMDAVCRFGVPSSPCQDWTRNTWRPTGRQLSPPSLQRRSNSGVSQSASESSSRPLFA